MPVMHPQILGTNSGEPAHAVPASRPTTRSWPPNGEQNVSRERVIELIRAHEGQPLALEILRDGKTVPVSVTPHKVDGTSGSARRSVPSRCAPWSPARSKRSS